MSSHALHGWLGQRSRELDEIEQAHRALGGLKRGRRYATQQINDAYLTLLSSQFQGFCRDLHTECIDFLITQISPASVRAPLREALGTGRRLDNGNPSYKNLKADFGRLGFNLDKTFYKADQMARLEKLNDCRNAIAHQDFDPSDLRLRLANVRNFRRLCNRLASMMDRYAQRYLNQLTGHTPWH